MQKEEENAAELPLRLNSNSDSKIDDEKSNSSSFDAGLSLEKIREMLRRFCEERNWQQYHTPRNLLLALTGEVGELAEIFQWKHDHQCDVENWPDEERTHLGEELSDVLVYLIRLADICKIDLSAAVLRKIELNGRKYPADKVYGSSKKYSDYDT